MKRKKNTPPGPSSERDELERQFETLQRDIRPLTTEHDLLKKANELIKRILAATWKS